MKIPVFPMTKYVAIRNLAFCIVDLACDSILKDSSGDLNIENDARNKASILLTELLQAYSWIEWQQNYRLLDPDNPRLLAARDILKKGEISPRRSSWRWDEKYSDRNFIGNGWFPMFTNVFPDVTRDEVDSFTNWDSNHAFQSVYYQKNLCSICSELTVTSVLDLAHSGVEIFSFSSILCACVLRSLLPINIDLAEADLLAAEYITIHRRYNPEYIRPVFNRLFD